MESPNSTDPLDACALCQWPDDTLVDGFCSECRPHVCSGSPINNAENRIL